MNFKTALSVVLLVGLISMAYDYAQSNCVKPLERAEKSVTSLTIKVQQQEEKIATLRHMIEEKDTEIDNLTSSVNLLNMLGEEYEEQNVSTGTYRI